MDQIEELTVQQEVKEMTAVISNAFNNDVFSHAAITLIQKLVPEGLSWPDYKIKIQYQVEAIIIGTLVCAATYSNYLSSKTFPAYPKTYKELEKIVSPETSISPQHCGKMIKKIGAKILMGELPFISKEFKSAFPGLKTQLNDIEDRYKKIETAELVILKKNITHTFESSYLKPWTFKFFMFGPHHKERAKAVLAAINRASNRETIYLILSVQENIIKGISTSQEDCKKLEAVGLSTRWTTVQNVKNKINSSKNLKKSGFFTTLSKAQEFQTVTIKLRNAYAR